MAKKNRMSWKKMAAIGVAGLAIFSGGLFWKTRVPYYTVMRVIDGDTFETTEKQLIRLADIFAPELGLCGSEDAKKSLEKRVMGKPVYLKVNYRDKYMRLISYVYTADGFVNEKMVASGVAVYSLSSKKDQETEILEKAAKKAVNEKLGVYGQECTQLVNVKNSNCKIKGNIRDGGNGKIYSIPGCESYASTIIQLYLGDKWFCTETDAKKEGFVKAGGCTK